MPLQSSDLIGFVSGSGAGIGDHIVVTGVPNRKIAIFALSIFTSTGVNCTVNFTDGPNGKVLFSMLVVSSNQTSLNFNQTLGPPDFLFCTSSGNDLIVNLSANITAVSNVSYFLI